MSFEYDRIGSGPPLLFVSGLYQSRQTWEVFARPLAGSFESVLFDFPGMSAEGGMSSERPEAFEDHVLALLDELSLSPAEVTACGLSFGGSLLRSLHLRRGVDFKALVLLSMNCPQLQASYRQFDRATAALLDGGGAAAYAGVMPFWLFSWKWLGDNPIVYDLVRSRYEKLFGAGDETRALLRTLSADVERGVPEGRFRCPTTLIHGDEDVLTPAKYARAYAESAGAKFCGIEGGHGFFAERPERALEALRQALLGAPG